MFNIVGDGSSSEEIVNSELGLKGEDDMFNETSVKSSNFNLPRMLRKGNVKIHDGTEEHVLSK